MYKIIIYLWKCIVKIEKSFILRDFYRTGGLNVQRKFLDTIKRNKKILKIPWTLDSAYLDESAMLGMFGMVIGAALVRVRAAQLAGGTIYWPLVRTGHTIIFLSIWVCLSSGSSYVGIEPRTLEFQTSALARCATSSPSLMLGML